MGVLVLLALRDRAALGRRSRSAGSSSSGSGQTLFAPLFAFVLRGQGVNVASSLLVLTTSGRPLIPIWKQSPIIGGGIETANRFLCWTPSDAGTRGACTAALTQALVGTGIVGITLLAATVAAVPLPRYLLAARGGRLARRWC